MTPSDKSRASWDAAPLVDRSALDEHLHTCNAQNGNLVSLHCAAQSLQGFVATRLITTIVLLAIFISLGLGLLAS
jgi:hypothetical protein